MKVEIIKGRLFEESKKEARKLLYQIIKEEIESQPQKLED